MKAIFFLALLGCAVALQGPVEYEYQYTARVTTGIHSPFPQSSGTGFKAKVRITMEEDGTGDIKLSDVMVGEGNSQLLDEGRQPLPVQYAPIQDKSIEEPYKAHFRKQDGDTVMEVPENDLLWVSNVRRGIVNFFRVAPIVAPGSVPHRQSDPSGLSVAFSKVMDTFAGRCLVEYTITPPSSSDVEHKVEEDIQSLRVPKGPGGQKVKLTDDYHLLRASIDFDTCADRVFISQTGAGNLTNVTSSNYRDVSSRFHIGEYLLKGEPGKFRMEKGVVESAFMFQPLGIDTAKMIIMSNQTMELLSVKPAPRHVKASEGKLKPLHTWNQQLKSPNPKPEGFSPRFIQYNSTEGSSDDLNPVMYSEMATGFKLTNPEQQKHIKDAIKNVIDRIVERLRRQNRDSTDGPMQYKGSDDGRIAQDMMNIQRLIRAVDKNGLKELDDQFKQNSDELYREVYVDALASAASGASQKVLLDKIKRGEVSDNRTASIFFNLANNIQSPEMLEHLVDYATSLEEEQHVVASLLVKNNLALIIRRLCVNPHTKTYSHKMYIFGKHMCDRSKIVNKYLPPLEQKIESATKTWVKILNVMAAANLGARESIPILEKVARGDITIDFFVRYAAIHSLSAENFDNTTRDQVFNVLQPIAESRREDYRIRQVAYNSLLTFKPNVTFIQRMIISSYNEPSYQVQSYISWVVDSLSRIEDPSYRPLSTAARNALALTRYMPASTYRPMAYLFSRDIFRDQVGSKGEVAWLSQYKSSFPREIYSFLAGKYGRFEIPLLETITFGKTESVYAKLKGAAEHFFKREGGHSAYEETERRRKLEDQFEAMHGGHGSSEQLEPDLYHFSKLWRTSQVFLPLTNELYRETKNYLQAAIKDMGKGEEENSRFFKYLNPVETTVILPTPVGLFAKIQLMTPTVLFGEVKMVAKTTPAISDPSQLPILQKISFRAEGIVKAITKTNSYTYVLAPWINKTSITGVDVEKTVSMPLKYEIEADLKIPAQVMWAKLTPKFNLSDEKIPVVKVRSLPFTAVTGLFGIIEKVGEGESTDLKPVLWFGSSESWYREEWAVSKENTGLNAEFKYRGEPQPPFSQSNVMRFLRDPSRLMELLASPSIKNYDMSIYQVSKPTETKSIGVALRFLRQDGSGEEITPESASKPIDISAEDTIQKREEKLQKFSNKENFEVSAHLNFTGDSQDKDKVYEAVVVYALDEKNGNDPDLLKELRKVQVAFLEKNDESSRPKKTCLVGAEEKDQLTPMPRPAGLKAEKEIRSELHAEVYEGQACSAGGNAVIKGKASLKVSEERVEALRNITGGIPMSRGNSSEFYRLAVYDQLDGSVDWTNPSDRLKNLTMRAQDLIEGYLFPKIIKNRLQGNEPNKMIVSARRHIGDNHAKTRVQLPKQTVEAQDMRVISLFDPLISFAPSELQNGQGIHQSGRRVVEASPSDSCLIKPDHVQTFDGVSYRKEATGCAASVLKLSQGEDKISVITRQPSQSASGAQELKVTSTKGALEIVVSGKQIQINGEEMTQQSKEIKDGSGNKVAKVSKSGDLVSISLTGKLEIAIKESNLVTIKLDQRFKNVARGLCGDFNSEAQNDLRGPRDCLYEPSRGSLYAAAWTVDESSCQEPKMVQLLKDVRKYRENCPKAAVHHAVAGSLQCSTSHKAYPLSARMGLVCVGEEKVVQCQDGCRPSQTINVPMKSKCWSEESAPEEVRDSISQGYMTSLPAEPAQEERSFPQKSPRACVPRGVSSNHRAGDDKDCFVENAYPVRAESSLLCVTKSPSRECKPECRKGDTEPKKFQVQCWHREEAPQVVKEAEGRGYTTEPVNEKGPINSELSIHVPRTCFKKEN